MYWRYPVMCCSLSRVARCQHHSHNSKNYFNIIRQVKLLKRGWESEREEASFFRCNERASVCFVCLAEEWEIIYYCVVGGRARACDCLCVGWLVFCCPWKIIVVLKTTKQKVYLFIISLVFYSNAITAKKKKKNLRWCF